jgi:phosphomevalonate kinase
MSPTRATAPGKMMLSGEYAVLDGAPALVAAVQRRAAVRVVSTGHGDVARGLDHPEPRFPEVAATRALAERELGFELEGELAVDVSELRGDEVKLGLGSSAAAAAATAALMFAEAGREPTDAELFDLAIRGHEEVAPQGSGADVASAVHGGTIHYLAPIRLVRPVPWPEGLVASVVFTGQAASTRELVGRVKALRASDRGRYDRCMRRLGDGAVVLAEAFAGGDSAAIVAAADDYGKAMGGLGQAAGAPIVEERLTRIAALAREAGGAAKPSGAGGGDVAIAFFTERGASEAFAKACASEGFEVLDVTLGGPGARVEAD